jgi:NTE family protein
MTRMKSKAAGEAGRKTRPRQAKVTGPDRHHAPPRPGAFPDLQDTLAPYASVALVLQGGGALGAYQAGVYEALSEAGIAPGWLSGVSIGAINAAIIAGNRPEKRLDRLRDFWETVSSRPGFPFEPEGDIFRQMRNQFSAFMTTMGGLPGFFTPRTFNPWQQFMGSAGATSYYDTDELRQTLDRLIDWKILNNQEQRLSVGAVNVTTGNFRYFDTALERIGPEHVMASGALPPAFPAVKIENEFYWDGGIVSNTPLQYLLEQEVLHDTLVFQVDLFSARGELPRDMADVLSRQKDITYSSRTRNTTDMFRRIHDLRLKLRDALLRVQGSALSEADRAFLTSIEDVPQINIVQLIYQQQTYEGHAKDYEFSAASMRDHWGAGRADTIKTLRHRKWLDIPSETVGMTAHDVHRDDPT